MTLQCITQLAMHIKHKTRSVARQHRISRLRALKHHRRNSMPYSDTFFLLLHISQGHLRSEIFVDEKILC